MWRDDARSRRAEVLGGFLHHGGGVVAQYAGASMALIDRFHNPEFMREASDRAISGLPPVDPDFRKALLGTRG